MIWDSNPDLICFVFLSRGSNYQTKGKKKPKKIKEGLPPDTSRAKVTKSYQTGKELRVDQELDKKKDIKEKDVFDFSKQSKK